MAASFGQELIHVGTHANTIFRGTNIYKQPDSLQ